MNRPPFSFPGLCLAAFLLASLLETACCRAETFYCDPRTGSPRGDGSREHPWRTVEEVFKAKLVRLFDADGTCGNPAAPVKPGDTLLLRSGWHGVLQIAKGFNTAPITIAADAGASPQLGWIVIREGRQWLLKGLTISPELSPEPRARLPRDLVVLGEHGGDENAELIIEDCFIYTVRDSSKWTAADWMNTALNGIRLGRHGQGHAARNNLVLNTRFGINLCAPDCVCEGNIVVNFSGDGIRATRDGLRVEHNVVRNNFVGPEDGDDNHDDGIQVFLFNAGKGTVRNVTIRSNLIVARDRDDLPFPNPLQGIGCFDGPLQQFVVEHNVVEVDNWHGISLYDAQECQVSENVCYSRWRTRPKPWIMLGQKVRQSGKNIVRDNLAHSFNFKADAEVTANRNHQVTATAFESRFSELAAEIEAKFGEIHATSGQMRIPRPAAAGESSGESSR